MKTIWFLLILLVASVILISGPGGFLVHSLICLLLLAFLFFTALPVTQHLFGRGITGLLLCFPVGYVLHSVALSFWGLLLGVNRSSLLFYMAVIAVLAGMRRPKVPHIQEEENWKRGESVLLLCWLLTTIALVALPLLKIGVETSLGFAYRVHFSSDFFKHMAVSGSLLDAGIPPKNPYLAEHPLYYYWFFYVIPAFCMQLLRTAPPELILIQFTLVSALIFVATLFLTLQKMIGNRKVLILLCPVFLLGGSYEGPYALYTLWMEKLPWTAFTDLNIDGITRWYWKAPEISALYRALLYNPQHLLPLSFVLISLMARNYKMGTGSRLILYVLIFSTFGFGALIGAVLILGTMLFLLVDVVRGRARIWPDLLMSISCGIFFLFLYFFLFKMFRLGTSDLEFGLIGTMWRRQPEYLLLNFGSIFLMGIAGLFWPSRQLPRRFILFYLAFCLICMHFIQDRVGGNEVSVKLGYFCAILLLISSAGLLEQLVNRLRHGTKMAIALVLILLLPDSITSLLELYNIQDVSNIRFTTFITNEDKAIFKWMRTNLESQAVVHKLSDDRKYLRRSMIPAFAQRPLYIGDKFHAEAFQVRPEELEKREQIAKKLLKADSHQTLCATAQEAGIQYIFIGSRDRTVDGVREKLIPPCFSDVLQIGGGGVVKVLPHGPHDLHPEPSSEIEVIEPEGKAGR